MEPHLLVSHLGGIPDNIISEFVEPLHEQGMEVEVEDRGIEVFAALEWLIPTAIVVILTHKYVETITQELAKEHYALLKRGLSTLLKRTVGRDKKIHIKLIASGQTPKKLSNSPPGAVSVYVESKSGQLIKFVTEDSLPPEQRESCLDALFKLLQDHNSKFPADALTNAVTAANLASGTSLIMRFEPQTEEWYLWSPRIGPRKDSD